MTAMGIKPKPHKRNGLLQSYGEIMNNIEAAIVRYEKARVLVSELNTKRSRLVSECEYFDFVEDNHGLIVGTGLPCSVAAWDCMMEINELSLWDEQIDYNDAFFNIINNEEGACDKCLEAMKIKRGELAVAKKEFGLAKRSISYHGKRLIKLDQ